MNLGPDEIVAKANEAPPFQRASVESGYSGQAVSWELEFNTVHQIEDSSNCRVMSRHPGSYPWVYFEIDLAKHPEFKWLNQGKHIKVSGRIDTVSGHDINLKEITDIEFVEDIPVKEFQKESGVTVETSSNKDTQTEKDKDSFVKQILLHPVYASLLVVLMLFVIYLVTGINLKDFAI